MKVFISWSGEISHRVAIVLHGWLPSVIQALKPYISSDINKGARWSLDVSKELESSSFGILCITKDSKDAPWLNFEAGALSKFVERSRVAPFLFRVELSEISEGPLSQFQATTFDKDDVHKLVRSLNSAESVPLLDKEALDTAFSRGWPDLADQLNEIKVSEPEAEEGTPSSQGKPAATSSQTVQQDAEEAKRLSGGDGTEQGQRQERLKNAIEHLGHDSGSVRLSGAYELFHLAEDEEGKKGLRQTVLDILCAHIRQTTGGPAYRKDYERNPSEEIQSLLTLLFVQKHKVFTGLNINLQGSWLNGSNLDDARLGKANLRGAQLHRAHLVGAQLHGANLRGAQLHGAYLVGAQLHGAHLIEAQLHRADLRLAQLPGAHLIEAQLHGANLRLARLPGAHLIEARLHGAHLIGAQLHGADLRGAQLHGADLRRAQLHEADLRRAQLHGASSNPEDLYEPFEAVINKRIGKQSDLSGAIFAGGLTPEAVASIGKGLPDEAAKKLREKLEAHIGKPESHELPENSGASIGAYTKEEAAQWIAEYKTALSAVSESG